MMLPVFFRVRTDIADLIELSTGEKVNFLNDLLFFLFSILLLFFFTKRFGPVIYLKNVTQGLWFPWPIWTRNHLQPLVPYHILLSSTKIMSCLDEDLITVLIRAALYRLNALTLRSDQKETSPSNINRFLSKKVMRRTTSIN